MDMSFGKKNSPAGQGLIGFKTVTLLPLGVRP